METIHILQKTYELLYVALIPLLNYLSDRLPAISSTWKRDCVERVLNERNSRDFSELDIYYLILILQDKENQSRILEMFPQDRLIYEDNSKLFLNIKDLRCDIMHPSFVNYTFEDFVRWTNTIESFIHVFNSEKSLSDYTLDLHQNEKNRLLNIIKNNVLLPALSSKNLSQEIKNSVQNTMDRLEKQKSAEGIILFFTDALRGNRGKEIAKELEKNGLQSFETIKTIVLQEYYS